MENTTLFRNYKIALFLVLIFILVTLLRLYPITQSDTTYHNYSKSISAENATSSLYLVFEDDSRRIFTGPLFEHTTILDVLIASSQAGEFTLTYERNDNEIVITEIDGLQSEKSTDKIACDQWCIYVNTVVVNFDVLDTFILQDGDIVEISTYELY